MWPGHLGDHHGDGRVKHVQVLSAGGPGQTVTVLGRGSCRGAPCRPSCSANPRLGTTTVRAAALFRMSITVPLDMAPGFHTLRVGVVGGTAAVETTLW